MWENQYGAWAGYDLVFVNVRGQGESKMTSGLPDFEGAIGDIDAIMNHFGIEKAVLVGHSWGGNPMQEYTLRHSDKVTALVLSGTWGQHRVQSKGEKIGLKITPIFYKMIPWTSLAKYSGKWCSSDEKTRTMVTDAIYESGRDTFLSLGNSAFKQVKPPRPYEGNPPMLFIRGDGDNPKTLSKIYSDLEDINPNARQVVIDNTMHQPMNDTPDRFNEILGEFLAEVAPLG